MNQPLRLGVAGLGTVGAGLLRLAQSHADRLAESAGRPIVVVTGMGVITSLGASKAENWRRLTAGESGIRAITRFSSNSR